MTNRKQRQQKNHNFSWKSVLWKITKYFAIVVGLIFLAGLGLFLYYASSTPNITRAELEGNIETQLYDRDNSLFAELGGENREIISPDEIPDQMKEAIIAIEDQRFYKHNGIDPIRIVGAALSNFRSRSVAQGGSTITQQLVKLSVFSTKASDQTLKRKSQEAILALKVEQAYSKDQILALYLNKIYFGNNVYGVETASQYYFGKTLSDLTLSQTATLAGMPQAPNNYDPINQPEQSQRRRNIVLGQMLEMKDISKEEYDQAIATDITDGLVTEHDQTKNDLVNDAFLQIVIDEVKEQTGLDVYKDGLQVYTTLDSDLQQHLYDVVNTSAYINYQSSDLQNAATILDTESGGLRAVIGGRHQDVLLGFNRATQLNRSVGSTIKPLTSYGPAIEYLNYSTGQTVVDEPYDYSSGDPIYNWDRKYMGTMTIRQALATSRNIPALKVFQEVGTDNITAFLKKLGITLNNEGANGLVESNAITGNITPLNLASAYRSFATLGKYKPAYTVEKVITRDGQEISLDHEDTQAIKPETAYMITDMLKDVFTYGTASSINNPNIIQAGKTGTTNYTKEQEKSLGIQNTGNVPDSWFVGYTTNNVISIWTGYDNPLEDGHSLDYTEQAISRDLYAEMISYITQKGSPEDWTMPDTVLRENAVFGTDPLQLAGPYTPRSLTISELFVKSKLPNSTGYTEEPEDPLAKPTDLQTSYDESSNLLTASWTGSGPKDMTFRITVNGNTQDVGAATSFEIPNITPGTTYNISVVAIADGETTSPATTSFTAPESENESDQDENESDSGNNDSDSNDDDSNDDDSNSDDSNGDDSDNSDNNDNNDSNNGSGNNDSDNSNNNGQ